MPTISEFYGIVVRMYYIDHPPPHFHVAYSGAKATFGIQSLEVLTGALPRTAERLVREWAVLHQDELFEDWTRCEKRSELLPIDPLR